MTYTWQLTEPTSSGKTYWTRDVHRVSENRGVLINPNEHRSLQVSTKNPLDYFEEERARMYINPEHDVPSLNLFGLQQLIYFLDHPSAHVADQAVFNITFYLSPERGLPLLDQLASSHEWRHLSTLHRDFEDHLSSRARSWLPNKKITGLEWETYIELYMKALKKGSRRQAEFHAELLCLEHFTRFFAFSGLEEKYGYFACRICSSSVNSIRVPKVIAVLDPQMNVLHERTDTALRINALQYNKLFDFDAIEIHPCSEDDIERFCIHVGNDTDLYRMERNNRVKISVSGGMTLTQESIRDLARFFSIQP
ncbi:MAG: hypothetical protein KTR29_13100 [Rhodothermaceae bacterium]|nr:hypothetical protein [Rhodothermaceae bacterium]